MKSVRFEIDGRVVEARPMETILEALLRLKIPIDHSCGGFGSCGTCRVFVVEGLDRLPDRNDVEREIAEDRGFSLDERLACQNLPVEGLRIRKP